MIVLCFVTLLWKLSSAVEVTLLDTTRQDALNWVTYSSSRGWREASYNQEQGNTLRVYMVCNIAASVGGSNWLRTPFISRQSASRLYIDVRFTMRSCNKYPEPDKLQQCKESLRLLAHEADADVANEQLPSWDTNNYSLVDVIAADQTFSDNSNPDVPINEETRSRAISKRGVYFAFYDDGACTTLLSVRVYYKMCPTMVVNLATFANATAGPSETDIVLREGSCVEGAEAGLQKPTMLCASDGNWLYPSGGCVCKPGYEPNDSLLQCVACPSNFYKMTSSNEPCSPCPRNSRSHNDKSTMCTCLHGYFRGSHDNAAMPCTKPPSAVRNLNVTFRDQTTVNVTWSAPTDMGGRNDISYSVECPLCPSHTVFIPSQFNFNTTGVTLTGLNSNAVYQLLVYAENGVSAISGVRLSVPVVIATQAAADYVVQGLHVIGVQLNGIKVAWNEPPDPYSSVELYEVVYWPSRRPDNASSLLTPATNVTIDGLPFNTEYNIQVRGKMAVRGWGEFCDPISITTSNTISAYEVNLSTSSSIGIIVGTACSIVICLIILSIIIFLFLRRNNQSKKKKVPTECDVLHCPSVEGQFIIPHGLGTQVSNGQLSLSLYSPTDLLKNYVDPHTYEDPNQAVREFTKEIDASCIVIESVIGCGEFGEVCCGRLRQVNCPEIKVAIKTLKTGASERNKLDFLTEASIMGQFDHVNVIYLEGVVTRSQPIMIITEFMENGSLDSFLRNRDGQFTVLQLVGMLRGIAAGMCYLSEKGYVHRDLAARNILVNETFVCKVADFGLAREIDFENSSSEYTTKGGKIPVRWTAPEAITYRKFTTASDVWSYGVVAWEVMGYGDRPYWNWSNQDVIQAVDSGYKLPPPMGCPDAVYQLMLDCWQKERSARPKFAVIVKVIDRLIRSPDLLVSLAQPRPYECPPDVTMPMVSLSSDSSVEDWLASIKMDRYLEHFHRSGYTFVGQVTHLMLKDLVEMGIVLIGHQKKIMCSIQSLRSQFTNSHMSEGFFI